MDLPTKMHGRPRHYDVHVPERARQLAARMEVSCHPRQCGWVGTGAEAVPFRDRLGLAFACPRCGQPVLSL